MNKAFYITGIVLSVVLIIVGAYYSTEVSKARIDELFSTVDSYFDDYNYYGRSSSNRVSDYTFEGAFVSLFFFLFFIASDLLGLIRVKTNTTKVLSIIGLSLSGIFLLWNFLVMSSDGGISYDEVYPAYLLYCLVMLAFSIVGLVQSVRFSNRGNVKAPLSNVESKDLLDS